MRVAGGVARAAYKVLSRSQQKIRKAAAMVPENCSFMRSSWASDTEEYEDERDRAACGGGLVGRQGAGAAQEDMGRCVDAGRRRPGRRRQGPAGERTQPRGTDGLADRDGLRDA